MFPLYSENGSIGIDNRTPTKGLESNFSILIGTKAFGCAAAFNIGFKESATQGDLSSWIKVIRTFLKPCQN